MKILNIFKVCVWLSIKSMFVYLGEKLTKEEAKGLMKELCEPEDDEGFMPFMRKYHLIYDSKWNICSESAVYRKKFNVTSVIYRNLKWNI